MDLHLRHDDQKALDDASHTELLASLNELLEAERAGARVAMETGREIQAADLVALVEDIHQDEVRWCGMLMRTIKSLGATPSNGTGAFHGKAMAIADMEGRLKFLNRGQAWVVRKLEALIPRMPDATRRAELQTMLEAHCRNIELVDSRLSGDAEPGPATTPRDAHPTEAPMLIEYMLQEHIQLKNTVLFPQFDAPLAPHKPQAAR